MTGRPKRLAGPAFISGSATDIYNPSANTYALVRQIHVVNKDTTGSSHKFTLYLGATGASVAGTELSGGQHDVPAGGEVDLWFPSGLEITTTDFLVGIAVDASKLTVTVLGELFAV